MVWCIHGVIAGFFWKCMVSANWLKFRCAAYVAWCVCGTQSHRQRRQQEPVSPTGSCEARQYTTYNANKRPWTAALALSPPQKLSLSFFLFLRCSLAGCFTGAVVDSADKKSYLFTNANHSSSAKIRFQLLHVMLSAREHDRRKSVNTHSQFGTVNGIV